MKSRTRLVGSSVTVFLLAALPRIAAAQAWSGEKGHLTLSLGSSFQFSDAVFWGGDVGTISGLSAQSLRETVGAEITPIEKLTVGATFTGQMDRYTGPQTASDPSIIVAHGKNDDGDWHGSIADANLEARYQLLDGAVALSPVLRAKIPMSDYPNNGYAAAGTGLFEIGGGAYVGKFGLFNPNIFALGGYTFTYVQKEDAGGAATEKYSAHHSDVQLQGGSLFLDGSALAALGIDFRYTHGGVNIIDLQNAPDAVYMHHDPILSRQYVAISAAGNYFVNDSFTVGLAFGVVVWGKNVSNAKLLNLTLSWDTQVL